MTSSSARKKPATSRSASGSRAGWIVGGVLLLVIAIVAVIAVLASGGDDDESSSTTAPGSQESRPVEISGTPLPEFTGGTVDSAIGLAAPIVHGAGFDGTPISIEPGKVTMVVFLAHWCPHCQREVPVLTQWAADGGVPEGVDVIGVATGTRNDAPNYPPSAWLAQEEFPFPVIADDATYSAGSAYGLSSFPYFVVIGAGGEVTSRASGELPTDQIEAMLAAAA